MASYTKFNQFTADLVAAKHDFTSSTGHVFKVMLTNAAPGAANAVKADITDIAAGNGYAAGGTATAMTISTATGTAKVTAADVVFTASGGSIGPFRYVVVYNDTQTTPAKPLVGFYDYGSAVTLATGETFTVDFDDANGLFTVA